MHIYNLLKNRDLQPIPHFLDFSGLARGRFCTHLHISKIFCTFAALSPLFMITNAHILAIDACLGDMRGIVRNMDETPDKQELIELLNKALDELMQANTDMSNAAQKVVMLTDHISNLNKSIYAPIMSPQLDFPAEGDYTAVRKYVEARKEKDEIFRQYCMNHSRKDLCERLSIEFGWVLDVRSFARNIQRH